VIGILSKRVRVRVRVQDREATEVSRYPLIGYRLDGDRRWKEEGTCNWIYKLPSTKILEKRK
jgi:hypothetical protein